MLNWEDSLKRHIAKKFSEMMGEEIPIENIQTIQMEVDLDLKLMSIKDLAQLYAFAVMKEDYEHADGIKEELAKRKHNIDIVMDEKKRCGSINVTPKKSCATIVATVPMIVCQDGMMIDWEKDDMIN